MQSSVGKIYQQGQRGTVGSFPEAFEFDHRSCMDQRTYWNSLLLNPVETQNLPNYPASPDTSMSHVNQTSEESDNLSIWNSGGPSFSQHPVNQSNHGDTKTEHGWACALTINGGQGSRIEERQLEANNMHLGSRIEERQLEAANMLSLNMNVNLNSNQVDNGQSFAQNSNANDFPQSSDHNVGHAVTSSQVLETGQSSHLLSGSVHVPSSGATSYTQGSSSRAIGFLSENGEIRPGGSFDGRRLSCKRKSIEGVPEQYSASGSSSYFRQSENSLLHSVSAHHNPNTSLSISSSSDDLSGTNAPEEQLNPRIGTTMRVGSTDSHLSISVAGNAESSRRNFRIRIDPAQHDAPPPNQWPSGNTVRLSNTWSTHQPSSLLIPFNQSLEPRPVVASGTSESQPHVLTFPGLVQNTHPFTLNVVPSTRIGSSSRSLVLAGDRLAASREETNSRIMPRNNISEHSIFAPTTDIRHLVQDPTNWSLSNGSISMHGHLTPTSRAGTSSRTHQSAATTWVPHQYPPTQYIRGRSEVRRSSYPPGGSECGGQSINLPAQHAGHSATSQEMSHQSSAASRGHQQPYMRATLSMDRQSDGVLGVPVSMRTLAAAREGRSRMMSEIRNALLLQRGENIRLEDVLIFDQSVFYGGAADLHDRHRDMRLDVDNMSYEELLALEERIGNVSTGLSEEMVLKRIKQRNYLSLTLETSKEVEPCCICQEEYMEGEELGTLDCRHDFHTACIKQWLTQKNLCPICKTTGLVT